MLFVLVYSAHIGWCFDGLVQCNCKKGDGDLKRCLETKCTPDEIHILMLCATSWRYCLAAIISWKVGGKTGATGRYTKMSRGTGGSTTS